MEQSFQFYLLFYQGADAKELLNGYPLPGARFVSNIRLRSKEVTFQIASFWFAGPW